MMRIDASVVTRPLRMHRTRGMPVAHEGFEIPVDSGQSERRNPFAHRAQDLLGRGMVSGGLQIRSDGLTLP
jgi:hypothetical protein